MLQYAVVGYLLHDIYRLYQLPDAPVSRFAAPPASPSVDPASTTTTSAAASSGAKSPKREEKPRET